MKNLLARAIGVALALGVLPAAYGAATLAYAVDDQGGVECVDNDPCDEDPLIGVVEINGLLGGVYNVTAIAGSTKPITTGDPLMDLGFTIQSITSDDHTLIFGFSETDFNLEGILTAEIGGTINGDLNTLEAGAWCDDTNIIGGTSTLIGFLGPFGAGAFSDSAGPIATCSTPYNVTQLILVTTTDTGEISGDFAVSAQQVPAPGTLALIGLGLMGFAALRRRQA